MNFNEKLQILRKEKSITQEELAEKLNVSRQAISKWESGQTMPEINKIIELAKIYGVSLDDILIDKEQEIDEKIFDTQNEITVKSKRSIAVMIMEAVLLGLGVSGISILYILYILNPVYFNGRFLNFIGFLDFYKLWPFIVLCSILLLFGFVMLLRNIIKKKRLH
jgi:Predicted transcriptional regulators